MKDDHVAVLLEDLNSKFDGVIEAVSDLATDVKTVKIDVAEIKEDVTDLKTDIGAIKAAVTHQSRELRDHEHRIVSLEHAA